jgi:NitT/TauT family transport system substrate-binding protein
MRKTLSCLLVALLCGLLFGIAPTPAQTLQTGYTSKTIFFLPFFVAQKKGFYQAEDIKVELIQMGTPAVSLQALIAGQIQICNINPDGIIIAGEKGANLKAIAGVVNGVAYTLVGGKPYKKLQDIKGTRLGVGSLKGGPTTFLLEYLRAKGLSYPRDYNLALVAGGTPARLAALESGAVSAAVLGVPQSDMALDRGFNRLGDVNETLPTFQFTTVNVNPSWAEKNRPVVVKFLKAHIRSLAWIHDHRDEATELVSRELAIKPPYSRTGLDYFLNKGLFPRDAAITLEGMRMNIEVQARDGLLSPPLPPPEKHIDLSYLKQAQKELGL